MYSLILVLWLLVLLYISVSIGCVLPYFGAIRTISVRLLLASSPACWITCLKILEGFLALGVQRVKMALHDIVTS